jgi:hypothetical protein
MSNNIYEAIDAETNKIRELEHRLKEIGFFIPFTCTVYKGEHIEAIMSWEQDPRVAKKHFRVFVELKKDHDTKIKKVLIESNLKIKFEMIKYLIPFVDNFSKWIREHRERIERATNLGEQ